MGLIAKTAADNRAFLAAVSLAAAAAAITYTSTTHRQGTTFLTLVGLMTVVGLVVGVIAHYRSTH